MRIFFGIVFGLLFLVISSIFLLVLNINQTVLQPSYVKNLAEKTELYQKVPQMIGESILQSGQVPANLQDTFVASVNRAVTPELVKVHFDSMIEQMLSDKKTVTENISDVNTAIIGNTDLGFLINNSKESALPSQISFDKSNNNFGRFVLNKLKIILITLIGSIILMFSIFFIAADNYKSRFKWTGTYLGVLAIISLAAYLFFRLVNFQMLTDLIKEENSISGTLDQVVLMTNIIKNDLSKWFLYEFIVLFIMATGCFVASAFIPKPVSAEKSTEKNNG